MEAEKVREVNSDRFQKIIRYHEDHGYDHSDFADRAVYDLICMVQREGLALDSLAAELVTLKDALERIAESSTGWEGIAAREALGKQT